MTIKYAVKWVISGDSCVQNTQELGSDISRNTAIPRRVEPKSSWSPAPVFLAAYVSFIQGMNVNLLVLEFMGVSAGSECILIQGLSLVKNSFITGKHVQAIFNILWNILFDCWGMI